METNSRIVIKNNQALKNKIRGQEAAKIDF